MGSYLWEPYRCSANHIEQIVNATVDKKSTKKELAEKIHKNLQEKRYLVVLDDLQELSVWKEFFDTFPDPKKW